MPLHLYKMKITQTTLFILLLLASCGGKEDPKAKKQSDYKVEKKYLLDKPKGVRGRSSDNTKIIKDISWEPNIMLKEGLQKTYKWIFDSLVSGDNTKKFTRF